MADDRRNLPAVRKDQLPAEPEPDLETALAGVKGGVRARMVQQIRDLVDKDPEKFVSGLRTWMRQDD